MGTVPSSVAPSRNCTLPVAAFGVTVAVRVTAWPNVAEEPDVLSAVLVSPSETVSSTTGETLAGLFGSPE